MRDSLPIDMLLSALSFLVVAQSISEFPEGLMNNPVYCTNKTTQFSVGKIMYERMSTSSVNKERISVNKEMLIKKHYKAFANFTKQLDKIKGMNL